jgi:putative ABC transport system permease protein
MPLALGSAEARFPNGRFQPFQVIGVDDSTLGGVPPMKDSETAIVLRVSDAVIVDPGGTRGKLETPRLQSDQWTNGTPHLDAPTRPLAPGDELLVNDHRVWVAGRSEGLPRFPPRPLMYTTFSNADRILLPERRRLTFVLATAASGVSPQKLATCIEEQTGLRARTADDFKADTVRWYLANSEDVEDVGWMLSLATVVGLGVTGVMLYMFTTESLWQYAVLSAMGATPRLLMTMIFIQAGLCGLLGTGLGIGLCAIVGRIAATGGYPFRMMWFTPLLGGTTVVLVSLVAAAVSASPVLKLQPMAVFERR